ncbi:MAG: MATE family efflux transporter [Eubacterium sp.]|nr:MATE family efflux transporter [Eubacterium sp.]
MGIDMEDRKGFYKSFFQICVALILQNVMTLAVNLADNMMIGGYSEISLSGVAAVNQIQFIYQQLLLALGDGVVIVCSQYWGKKKLEPMRKISAIGMQSAMIIAGVLFFLVSVFPMQMMHLFTDEMPIIAEGMEYLAIIRFTYFFFAVSMLLLAVLRSVEIVKIAFILSVITFCINCGINAVLIYGRFGFPELGVRGAAIGTLAARIIECIVVLFFVIKKEDRLRLKLQPFFRFHKEYMKDYFRITLPNLIVQGLWGVNTALQTVILGHMTAAAIAANSMASTLFSVIKSMAIGSASAASVIIGKAIGSGNMEQVQSYSKILQKMFLLIGVAGGIVLFFLRIPVLSMYNLSEETMRMANQFLIVLSVILVGMSYQMPTNTGIIRGGGNAMHMVKMDLVSIWCIVIPVSFLAAFVFHASPLIVVCCLNSDQIFKCIPAYVVSNHRNWVRVLTKES